MIASVFRTRHSPAGVGVMLLTYALVFKALIPRIRHLI